MGLAAACAALPALRSSVSLAAFRPPPATSGAISGETPARLAHGVGREGSTCSGTVFSLAGWSTCARATVVLDPTDGREGTRCRMP